MHASFISDMPTIPATTPDPELAIATTAPIDYTPGNGFETAMFHM